MKKLAILLAIAPAILSGCAAQMAKDRADALSSSATAVMSAPTCCKGLAEFSYERTSIPFESKSAIDRSGPAFDFPNGKSFFRAFQLPEYQSPYVLEVTSRLAGAGPTVDGMWLFYPVLLFLDGSFKPTATVRDLPFRFTSTPWTERYGMQVRLLINESARAARYLIVFTEPQFMSRTFDFRSGGGITPIATGGGTMFVPSNSNNFIIPFNYEGRVDIRLLNAEVSP